MTNHAEGHPESQRICDSLLCLMQDRQPDIERKEAKHTCAISQRGQSRFVFLYHRKTTPEVTIYFRSDPDKEPQGFPPEFSLQVRPQIRSGWEKSFPYFFAVPGLDDVAVAVSFLLTEAWPLSITNRQSRPEFLPPEEVATDTRFREGSVRSVIVNVYERNRVAREACLRHWGRRCSACDFDFGSIYGQDVAGFIHVHHLVPLSGIGEAYELDPIRDLRPVCPNCHAVLHRKEPPLRIEELKFMIHQARAHLAMPNKTVPPDRGPRADLSERERIRLVRGR
jgi:hypothetical protein